MKTTAGGLVLIALLLGPGSWAPAAGPAATAHHGKGRIVAIGPGRITLAEPPGHHAMRVDATTEIVIPREAQVSRLGVGDYVAEECIPDGKGGSKAVRLTLYRPAWMDHASPEY